ncbi:MAG TPA: hypothetical protein PKY59_00190 [Pyrinomonadaceae bacterium]|nr:hypothetical protein [Pyrinomonadaceae bacterium]
MKDGICPKCKSEEVYIDTANRHGIIVPVHSLATRPTHLYVCVDCGYLEFYARTGFDLQKVKEKFKKVKN